MKSTLQCASVPVYHYPRSSRLASLNLATYRKINFDFVCSGFALSTMSL